MQKFYLGDDELSHQSDSLYSVLQVNHDRINNPSGDELDCSTGQASDGMIFDRKSQFLSKFLQCLFKFLRVDFRLFSRFQPQYDEHTESTN